MCCDNSILLNFQDEFLLSAPEGLGMFVNAEGMSNRPPIQWSYPLLALAYFHPYILGLSDEVIMVYSILDQQQKQALPFIGGKSIGNFDGCIYVTSGTAVYNMVPVPWEKQVEVWINVYYHIYLRCFKVFLIIQYFIVTPLKQYFLTRIIITKCK
ncbi:hypothetical protein C0J52_14134 [Blattella germanica]|nr:hypothetical protein C0J52_14134 [Blattella germanica]